MAEEYASAAVRHLSDGARLANAQRYDNAGHLIGFAAECALKHAYGLAEPADQNPRVHLPDLANALLKRMRARNPQTASLFALLSQTRAGYFNDWKISDRYAADQTITKAMYDKWDALAKRTLGAAGIRQ